MSVKILQNVRAISDERGVQPLTTYKAGDTFPTDEPWQRAIADNLIRGGMAEEAKVVSPSETKAIEPERARNADGTLIGDDKSTPDTNEAWVGGKAPKKSGRPKTSG
jgi:hypothetical protein